MNATITTKQFQKALDALAKEACANILAKMLETAQQKQAKRIIQHALAKAVRKRETKKLVKLNEAFRQPTLDVKTRTLVIERTERIVKAKTTADEYVRQSNDATRPEKSKLWALLNTPISLRGRTQKPATASTTTR